MRHSRRPTPSQMTGFPNPTTPSGGRQRLSNLGRTARGNATLLHDALLNAEPRDLTGELIQEFLLKCRRSQEHITSQLPGASAEARRSRRGVRNPAPTEAEQLLQELSRANQELTAVLRLYDDLIRAGPDAHAQERIKNQHTIRSLASGFVFGALSLGDRHSPSSTPPSDAPPNDDEVQRLLQVSKTGRGNAELLYEALIHAEPEELQGALIQEFRSRCRETQEEISDHIVWADIEAAKSRRLSQSTAPTREEQLLRDLLTTDDALADVLKMYDDLERARYDTQAQQLIKNERTIQALASSPPPNGSRQSTDSSPGQDGDVQRLFSTCQAAWGNAELLHEALMNAKPEDLQGELVQEFCSSCRASQEEILAKIPWATAEAERSRRAARTPALTTEERLVESLLGANEELVEALKMYHELGRAGTDVLERKRIQAQNTDKSTRGDLTEQCPSVVVPNEGGSSRAVSEQSLRGFPPLTSQDKAKFAKIFFSSSPQNGVLSGLQARDLLLKSKLPPGTLSQIWDLSDMQRRGVLDVAEFTIAMYLVQSCMSGQLTTVPPSLPPLLYEQAGVALAPGLSATIIGMRPSDSSVPRPSSHLGAGLVAPHSLPDAIGGADRAFDILDPQGTGRALGEVVAPFMLQLGMPVDVLTRIWALVDTGQKGYLTREEFAAAMNLIDMKNTGKELPVSLPASPVPSTRERPINLTSEGSLIDLDEPVEMSSTPAIPPRPGGTSPVGEPSSSQNSFMTLNTKSSRQPLAGPSHDISPFQTPPASPLVSESFTIQRGQGVPAATPSWDIDPVEKTQSDALFDTLDPRKTGYIEGDVAITFLAKSRLPDGVMAAIWDVADMNHDGRLARHEFAVAMHLVREKLRGKELPSSLPPGMIAQSINTSPARPNTAIEGNARFTVDSTPPPSFTEMVETVPRADTPPPPYESISGERS
ncbi:hypothetical protein AcV7_009142 [Taiwanofungus camphoratus]|nr:hypothetical protein AcV7_009142 [Antrodia cinnamomea]